MVNMTLVFLTSEGAGFGFSPLWTWEVNILREVFQQYEKYEELPVVGVFLFSLNTPSLEYSILIQPSIFHIVRHSKDGRRSCSANQWKLSIFTVDIEIEQNRMEQAGSLTTECHNAFSPIIIGSLKVKQNKKKTKNKSELNDV